MPIEFSHQRYLEADYWRLRTAQLRREWWATVIHRSVLAAGVVLLSYVCARLQLSAVQSGLVLAGGGALLWGLSHLVAALVVVNHVNGLVEAAVANAREERVRLTALEEGLEVIRGDHRELVPWAQVRAGRFKPAGGLLIEPHGDGAQPYMVARHQVSTATDAEWESFCSAVVACSAARPAQFPERFL